MGITLAPRTSLVPSTSASPAAVCVPGAPEEFRNTGADVARGGARQRSTSASRRMREAYAETVRSTAPVAPDVALERPSSISAVQSIPPERVLHDISAAHVATSGVRVHLGILEFKNGGDSYGGLFDTTAFRILLQFGGDQPAAAAAAHHGVAAHPVHRTCSQERPVQLASKFDDWPASQPKELRFGRVVSADGRYASQFTCDFDEAIDMACPRSPGLPSHLSADVWQEQRTAIGKFDRVLSHIGLGSNVPEHDRLWLGRCVINLPAPGEDRLRYPWPVEADGALRDGAPVPKCLSVGIEWLDAAQLKSQIDMRTSL